jgi:hypothetical protein
MPQVKFKTRIEKTFDETPRAFVRAPALKRSHCDMNAFRSSREFSSYANSDLFESILARAKARSPLAKPIFLDSVPDGVTVETNGFFATVTCDLKSWREA